MVFVKLPKRTPLHLLVALAFGLLASLALAQKSQIGETDWKLVKDKNGIQVFRAHSETSRLKTFKVVTRFDLDDIRSFVAMLLDETSYPEWGHMISSAEISGTDSESEIGIYMTTRLPWPVKNRHVKCDYQISQADDYSIRIDMTQSPEPPPEKKGYILSPEAYGYFILKTIPGSREVELRSEVFVDPGGYVPAFLVNIITDDLSYFSTKKIRRYVQNEKYQNVDIGFIKRRPWVADPDTRAGK